MFSMRLWYDSNTSDSYFLLSEMCTIPKNKEATTRFAKQIVPAGKASLIVNAMLQRINMHRLS